MSMRSILALAAGLALAACAPAERAPEEASPAPVRVTLSTVTRALAPRRAEWPATIQALPERSAALAPTQPARVLAVPVHVGQAVRAGQALAILERDPAARAARDRARQAEALAALEARRQARLFASGVASRAARDQAESAYAAARADLAAAEAGDRLAAANATLVAPFGGVVSQVALAPGTVADPGRPGVSVLDLRVVGLTAEAAAPGDLRAGAPVQAVLGDGRAFPATISAIEPVADPQTQRVRVRATAPNPEGALRVGLFATLRWEGPPASVLALPDEAIARDDEGPVAYVVGADAVARRRAVRPGLRLDGGLRAVEGLKEGERVVRQGAELVSDGAPLDVSGER